MEWQAREQFNGHDVLFLVGVIVFLVQIDTVCVQNQAGYGLRGHRIMRQYWERRGQSWQIVYETALR